MGFRVQQTGKPHLRCRHAFEVATVHANGDVVCSIIDGRGDFVMGNIHRQSLTDVFKSDRATALRKLVLSTGDSYCRAIGKNCALKSVPVDAGTEPVAQLKYLAIEPTSACDLRCLSCPVRDFSRDVTWRDAYRDGGLSFLLWDGLRRAKQHATDALRRRIPALRALTPADLGPLGAMLLRGRPDASRSGTLPLDVLKRVVDEAGPDIERLDLFSYGEPFLYRHLVDALRHVRQAMPRTKIAISTDGMQVREPVEAAIIDGRLLDWIIFSVDGSDPESYRRYRIRGKFEIAFGNLKRFNQRAAGSGIQVVWQYVVFRWNDSDAQLKRALALAADHGLTLCFDFAHTWGRSRRRLDELRWLEPHLKPFTALPGEARHEGW